MTHIDPAIHPTDSPAPQSGTHTHQPEESIALSVDTTVPGRRFAPKDACDARLPLDKEMRDLLSAVDATLSTIEIAEDEICSAQQRHGEKPPVRDGSGRIVSEKGPIWKSFWLLRPTGVIADRTEFVYRAHCKELLDRVAYGQDTRPATDAEMLMALSQTSLAVPLNAVGAGLYMRLFTRSFPDQASQAFGPVDRTVGDYERLYDEQMSDLEAFLRHKARQEWRVAAAAHDQD